MRTSYTFEAGQLADIANVVLSAGETCVDLGLIFGSGFGQCIPAEGLLETSEQEDVVEMWWGGGKYAAVITPDCCLILEVRCHFDCQ